MFRNRILTRNPFAAMFQRTLPEPTQPARDNEGRFLPHRIAIRKEAIRLAKSMGRDDLVARLTGETA